MNKKNLSVVMAGAMLATSVAPVLADTTTETKKDYEVNGSNVGLLITELRKLINSKTFENIADNKNYAGHSVYYVTGLDNTLPNKDIAQVGAAYATLNEELEKIEAKYGFSLPKGANDGVFNYNASAGEVIHTNGAITNPQQNKTYTFDAGNYELSVYFNGSTGIASNDTAATIMLKAKKYDNTNFELLEEAIKTAPNGTKLKVYDRGYVEKDGKYYAFSKEAVAGKFEKADLEAEYEEWKLNKEAYKAVYEMSLNDEKDKLTVKTRTVLENTEETRVVYEYGVGSEYVDFKKPINKDKEILNPDYTDENGNSWVTSKDLYGFAIDEDNKVNAGNDIPEKHLYTITISDADNVYNVELPELYDGLFLTEDGQELIDTMKLYDSKVDDGYIVKDTNPSNTDEYNTFKVNDLANGLYSIEIEFSRPIPSTNNSKRTISRVVVTSNNRAQMELFANGLRKQNSTEGASRKFPAQILAGSNRYETAVKVAKENADITTVAENGNIVLVNGNSLVDGLAAAPLAASAQNVANTIDGQNYAAPILLTDANGIPKATKDYMKEVIGEQQVKNLDKVTVYLVGGEAVISKSVENQLKEMGLRVVRAGGADREETSLAVAELMYKDGRDNQVNKDDAFLVGANGEADAMSIASVAAATKTPIIVESVHGISEDTVEFLKGYKNTGLEGKDVTIIGGETAVSASTEQALKDEKLSVERIAGSNRKETNAKVIDSYYGQTGNTNGVLVNPGHKFNNVVVSKDGMNNKSELIDALTATSLAVRDYAPIVLGTNSLSKSQINALEKNADRNGVYVYQVGHGVARDVVKTIAERIGLAK